MVKNLSDSEVQYMLIRLQERAQGRGMNKVRDVFIAWTGPNVSTMAKGQKRSHVKEIQEILQPFHSELTAVSKANFNEETVLRLSGPHAGTHVID